MSPAQPRRRAVPPGRRLLPPLAVVALLGLALGAGGCATGINYPDPAGPRYAGALPAPPPPSEEGDTLLVVSFNVKYAERPDSALAVLRETPEIEGADLILLQEMDAPGTERIARGLGMGWVYYPAVERKASGRDFGNAVLSRWPIEDDEKVLLPYRSVFGGTRRIATVATVRVRGTPVRVYSVHLATPVNMAWRYRREQWDTVLEDARAHPRAIIGGDLNSGGLGKRAARRGFAWPTEEGPPTLRWGRWDHIVLWGLRAPDEGGSGTVLDNRGASDHLPVWARVVLGG